MYATCWLAYQRVVNERDELIHKAWNGFPADRKAAGERRSKQKILEEKERAHSVTMDTGISITAKRYSIMSPGLKFSKWSALTHPVSCNLYKLIFVHLHSPLVDHLFVACALDVKQLS